MGNKQRQSNLELLRILSIMLIMMMHSFGTPLSTLNEYVVIGVSVIGNIGTTCFIILSGYFGIKCNVKKLVQLDIMIILYSLAGFLTDYCLTGEFSAREFLSCLIPITSHRYWFLSCYFFLCILSPFINEYIDGLERKRMGELIGVMLFLFALLPTLFGFDVMQDGGKGLVNMTLAYVIGRYLGKYADEMKLPGQTGKCIGLLVLLVVVNFGLNAVVYAFTGSDANYYARDNSVFTIAEAVLLFLLFRRMRLKSSFVNAAAANVVAVYVLEPLLSHVLRYFWDYTAFADRFYYMAVVLFVVFITLAAGLLIEAVRKGVFGRAEQALVGKSVNYIEMRMKKWKK